MKSYYYHSRLTIGWRMFNHIENSSSHTHNFDECNISSHYHRVSIEMQKLLQNDYIIKRK